MKFLQERIDKPWGYEILWALTDSYAGKLIHIEPNKRLSLQYHEFKDETIFVMSGTLELRINDKDVSLHQGDSFHIEHGTIHRFFANDDPVDVIEVSTNQLSDVIRIQDDHGRI